MWVRSYLIADVVAVNRQVPVPSSQTVWSAAGYFGLYHWDMPAGSDVRVSPVGWFYSNGPASGADPSRFLDTGPGVRRLAGVAYRNHTYNNPGRPLDGLHERALVVPYWILIAALGAWP